MCSSVVERCPDKTEVEGSIPSTRTQGGNFIDLKFAASYKTEVEGSIPSTRTTNCRLCLWIKNKNHGGMTHSLYSDE